MAISQSTIYDISRNSQAISNIDENDFALNDKLIKLDYDTLPLINTAEKQLVALSALSGTYTTETSFKCWKALNRINTYLQLLQTNISSLNDIVSESQLVDSFDINSAVDEFSPTTTVFGLTDYNEKCERTFNTLTSFLDKTLNFSNTSGTKAALDRGLNETSTISFTSHPEILRQIFFSQNFDMKLSQDTVNTFLIRYKYASSDEIKNQIINFRELYIILNAFILRLANTKKVNLTISLRKNDIKTSIQAFGKSIVYISNFSNSSTGRNINVTIGPYSQQNITDNASNLVLYKNQSIVNKQYSYVLLRDRETEDGEPVAKLGNYVELNLGGLVYDISGHLTSEKILPLTLNCTNGTYGYELRTINHQNFDLKLTDVLKLFNISRSEIISRKNVLNAIDYIFNYWIEHISTLEYNVTICHNNCHTNEVTKLFGTETTLETRHNVSISLPLHYTGGCGCGSVLTGTINFRSLLPTNGAFTSDSTISVRCEIGGYSENASPRMIYVNGSEIPGYTSGRAFSTTLSFKANAHPTFSVYAELPTDVKKEKQRYFCIKLTFTTTYVVTEVRKSE